MISFLMLRNGKRLRRGAVREGVLSAIVDWVTPRPERPSELHCTLAGLETSEPQQQHLDWVELADLTPGDEITIRIEDGHSPDPPIKKRPSHQHRKEPDGSKSPRRRAGVAGADVYMCARCLALAAELLDRRAESIFHLRTTQAGRCSFCSRDERTRTVVARDQGIPSATSVCGPSLGSEEAAQEIATVSTASDSGKCGPGVGCSEDNR